MDPLDPATAALPASGGSEERPGRRGWKEGGGKGRPLPLPPQPGGVPKPQRNESNPGSPRVSPTGGYITSPTTALLLPAERSLVGKPRHSRTEPAAQPFAPSAKRPLSPAPPPLTVPASEAGVAAWAAPLALLPSEEQHLSRFRSGSFEESWRAPWARPTQPPVTALARSLPAQQPPLPSPPPPPPAITHRRQEEEEED